MQNTMVSGGEGVISAGEKLKLRGRGKNRKAKGKEKNTFMINF